MPDTGSCNQGEPTAAGRSHEVRRDRPDRSARKTRRCGRRGRRIALRVLHASERPLNASEGGPRGGPASRVGLQHPPHAAGVEICRI